MTDRLFIALFAGAVAVPITACGGDTADGGTAAPVRSEAATLADYTKSECALLAPCCARVGKSTSPATCEAYFSSGTLAELFYNPAAGAQCLAAQRAYAQKASFCDEVVNEVDSAESAAVAAACVNLFDGGSAMAKLGEKCQTGGDCAPSPEGTVSCAASGDSSKYACQVTVAGKAGDGPCLFTIEGNTESITGDGSPSQSNGLPSPKTYSCDRRHGLYCAVKLCSATLPAGSPCTSDECEAGTYCSSSGAPTCVPRLGIGAACSVSTECASLRCQSGVCVARDGPLDAVCGK